MAAGEHWAASASSPRSRSRSGEGEEWAMQGEVGRLEARVTGERG